MLDKATIEKLKSEHGEIHRLTVGTGEAVVVKLPSRAVWKRFRKNTRDAERSADAGEQLLRDCVVHPSPDDFSAMLEKRPGLAEAFGGKLVELAGGVEDAEAEKL